MKKKQIVVVGLGRFGSSVCRELYKLGHEVMALDMDPDKVEGVAEYASQASVADATDKSQLKALGVRNFDQAIVAIGDDLQASVLCTLMLKEIGLEKVWVKARDLQHKKILEKVGADRVIQPEFEMGVRVAHHVDSEKIVDYIDLSDNYSIVEMAASKKIAGKSLLQLDIRTKFNCITLAVKRGQDVNIAPHPDDVIAMGDILVVMGHRNDLKKLEDKRL
ncbi:TrkA family potassium uptake protein [Planomicrobium sp. Y74]|uniref:potassium channel family protein n=1 Tax=Planomicrobium sp. Y74 TaxID=2478977 RepID=UPI000EF532F3|nr:TrkA family potassium uptake protein [Planomicrobium sp. Y74]RLQ90375.1 TrkA family potassium uptake protein [Planomicrobium sp. Y74]